MLGPGNMGDVLAAVLGDGATTAARPPKPLVSTSWSASRHANRNINAVLSKAGVLVVVGAADATSATVNKVWSEHADRYQSLLVDVHEFIGGDTSAEGARARVRDAVAKQLKNYPGSVIRLEHPLEVDGVLTLFHKCWDDKNGWLAVERRESTASSLSSKVDCRKATFVVNMALGDQDSQAVLRSYTDAITLQGLRNCATAAGVPSLDEAKCYNLMKQSVQAVLQPKIAKSERGEFEGEAEALMRRLKYWAVMP